MSKRLEVTVSVQETTRTNRTCVLPTWCSGEPVIAAAIYLFGYANAVRDWDMKLVTVREVEV